MIVKITGLITEIGEQFVVVERDGLAYEVLVPGFALRELSTRRGFEATLHTLEFLEGSAANGNLVPRLIGFPQREERAFFCRFIEVKGIGPRKALKALSEPIAAIASWIRDGQTAMLAKLPGIGRRGAELVVAELKGKIEDFALQAIAVPQGREWTASQSDALDVIVAWGDSRADAVRWMERAVTAEPHCQTPEEWVKACYRIKAGGERISHGA